MADLSCPPNHAANEAVALFSPGEVWSAKQGRERQVFSSSHTEGGPDMTAPLLPVHEAAQQPVTVRSVDAGSVLPGWLLIAGALTTIIGEFGMASQLGAVSALMMGGFVITQLRHVSFSVAILALASVLFTVVGLFTREDMLSVLGSVSVRSAWVLAVFVSLLSLRAAVADIPAIMRSGHYLVSQPPGRRYGSLTIGSHLFSNILQLGAVTLLGGLVTDITGRQPDDHIRQMRERRMLLAIQRGFTSALCWSPIAFPMIISTAVVPDSDWLGSLAPALSAGLIIMGIGWLLDTVSGARTVSHQQHEPVAGSAKDLVPLVALLFALLLGTALMVMATGVATSVAVLILVPFISIVIVLARTPFPVSGKVRGLCRWADRLASVELPIFAPEAMLVAAAAFSGLLSVELIGPMVEGMTLPNLPSWLVSMLLVLWMPIAGQLALHPILAASIAAGFVHEPARFGLTPDQVVVALTSGWALSGASSPFTAVVSLVARMGRVSPYTVGLRWNGVFVLLAAVTVSLWIALVWTPS